MENSKVLLDKAISIINEASVPKRIYSVGGGTVLSFFYNHRVSKDIDIFINDPQFLSSISPRLNNSAEEALDYDENNNFISQIKKFNVDRAIEIYQNAYERYDER